MTLETIFNPEFCVRLTWTLLHFLWQGVAVALLALVTNALLRCMGAAVRYWVFVVALAIMVLCPPITFLVSLCPAHRNTWHGVGF